MSSEMRFPRETCEDRYNAEVASLNSLSDYLLTSGFSVNSEPVGFLQFIEHKLRSAREQIPEEDIPRLNMIKRRFDHSLPKIINGLERFRLVAIDAAFTKLADSRERIDRAHYNTPEAISPKFDATTLHNVTRDFVSEYNSFQEELIRFLRDRSEEFYNFNEALRQGKEKYNPVLEVLSAYFDEAVTEVEQRLAQTKKDLGRLLHYHEE